MARLWKVKDVASHMLDTTLRNLSTSRDGYHGEPPGNIHSYRDLVDYLNGLNMQWTRATKRLSPEVLISLLELTLPQYRAHLQTLNPFDRAIYSVAWAGQETSQNWFHIAREYTEKFLHQQQIRDAVGKPGLMTQELFLPFLNTFMYALPVTFKSVKAPQGTVVSVTVTGDVGGQWSIIKEDEWTFTEKATSDATLRIPADIAWKLFSRSLRPEQVLPHVEISGNEQLAKQALEMVSVMA